MIKNLILIKAGFNFNFKSILQGLLALLCVVSIFGGLLQPQLAWAADDGGGLGGVETDNPGSGQLTNPVIGNWGNDPEGATDGSLFIKYAVYMWRAAISLGALVVLAFYVLAAFEWLTSGSDSQGAEKARNRFINATIGLVILVSSFSIVAFIGDLFFGDNFDLLKLTFPTPN
jgi:hypothetical protein